MRPIQERRTDVILGETRRYLERPEILVFDVNETLIDIESLQPLFERVFGDRERLREWFGQVVTYSMALTLSEQYVDFFTLGRSTFTMIAAVHNVELASTDLDDIESGMRSMPAHEDVEPALRRLSNAGYRLATLTNSPSVAEGLSPLERAGIAGLFERRLSVHSFRAFKPASRIYRDTAVELGVPASSCLMIAAHMWDTMGAQSAGFGGGLITRRGNAPLHLPGVPTPDFVASDLHDLADQVLGRWDAE